MVGFFVEVFAQAGDRLLSFLALCDQILNLRFIGLDYECDIVLVKRGHFNFEQFELLCVLVVDFCQLVLEVLVFLLCFGIDFIKELKALLMEFQQLLAVLLLLD